MGFIKELFGDVWSIFSEIFVSLFFIFVFLVYYNVIYISEKTLFLLSAVGYGIIVVFNLQGRRKERKDEIEIEKTLVVRYNQMFFMEIVAFLAAVGILAIVYYSEEELTIVNVIQSLFIFFIVKLVNWYYLKQQI